MPEIFSGNQQFSCFFLIFSEKIRSSVIFADFFQEISGFPAFC
jgi:hypothetical protein